MPIARMGALLEEAGRNGRAVGAFNVANLEMIRGVCLAAEKTGTPVILQIAEGRLDTSPLYLIGPAMVAAAKASAIPVAVHLDHGHAVDRIREAISLGFTSVMYDASHLPLEENIEKTGQVVADAHAMGVEVEAEIGQVGRSESGADGAVVCADPRDAFRYVSETGADALAVGIGNAHGTYAGTPHLRFDILAQIRETIDIPMVLHGGTGISPHDFRRAIALGIRKINIATALFQAAAAAARETGVTNLFELSRRMTDATEAAATAYIRIFGLS